MRSTESHGMINSRVLVTGGAGFVGSHLAEFYAEKGSKVTILDNFSRAEMLNADVQRAFFNWNYLRNKYRNVKLARGDVRNFEEVKASSKGTDIIIHAAGQVAVTTSLKNPRKDFEINASGTLNVLEAARLSDAKFILCSTNKVYGENVNNIPLKADQRRYSFADDKFRMGIPETFPIDLCAHSPYGSSKLVADIYAQDYAHTYGLVTGVFRMSCIYGERQFGVEDQGWVAWFVRATLSNHPITIYGDGRQVRDVLYIADLVRLFDAFVKSRLRHGVFNVGGGPENTLSLLEMLQLLEEISGRRPIVRFADWRQADQKVYVSDISKAKKILKWEPKTSPKVGLNRLVKWVAKEGVRA